MPDFNLPAFHNLQARTISVTIPGEIAMDLDLYRTCYQQAHGVDVSDADLLREMARRFIEADVNFQGFKKKQKSGPRPATKPPGGGGAPKT